MWFDRIFLSLLQKEVRHLLRNRQILAILFITPAVQLLLYGLALSPEVKHLRLGVVDFANSPMSREFVARMAQNEVFDIKPTGGSTQSLFEKVQDGDLDAGIVIPPDFERRLTVRKRISVQVVLNGVDANTAGIASGYITQMINAYNLTLANMRSPISPDVIFAYNPGLLSTWFFVPSVIAMSLTVAGTLVSSSSLLREKETGTMEQLLMTPAEPSQILLAKIIPLIALLFLVVIVTVTMGMIIFHLPFRGNPLFFAFVSLLYMFVLIALGLALATYAVNQRQAIMTTFFVMLPVIQLSGALSPLESMPEFWQYVSLIDPLRFFISCVRGILLKGNGVVELWFETAMLIVFATSLMAISTSRFRKQLL